jgi:4-diphosphocytidyl-2C-methyl-D-erythritol kinase
VYRSYDALPGKKRAALPRPEEIHAGVLAALSRRSWRPLDLRNGLEPAALRLAPELAALKLALGAERAFMTGSGSGMFALFGARRGVAASLRRAERLSLRLAHAGKVMTRRAWAHACGAVLW